MDNQTEVIVASDLSSSTHCVVAVVYALLSLTAFLLNSLVLFTFVMDRSLLTAPNMFIVSIAVADWLMAVAANPLGVVANVLKVWPFDRPSCVYYAWLTSFLGLSTMLHHSVLAVERYRAVSGPFSGQSTRKRNLFVIFLLWLFTLIWSLCPLFGWSAYGPEGANTMCSIRWHSSTTLDVSFVVCIFLVFFFIPLLIIMASYIMTYRNVRCMVSRARSRWGSRAAPTLETISKAVCFAKIAVLMVTGFFIAWTPYAVVSMYAGFSRVNNLPALATVIPAMFAKSASLYNPLIYFFLYKKFRVSVLKLSRRLTWQSSSMRRSTALDTHV